MTIKQQPVDSVKWVDRNELEANDYNPNHVAPRELKLLKTSILETGWTQPIVVLNDGKTIIDGFHRWTLSGNKEISKLTGGKVPIVICDIDSSHQILATVRHNRARGTHGIDPMASIVIRLLEDEELSVDEVMDRCGMEREEVERLSEIRPMPELIASERAGDGHIAHGGTVGEFSNARHPGKFRPKSVRDKEKEDG